MGESKRIFVDANYFAALFNPSDTLHKKALSIARKIDREEIHLMISNFIFLEVVTILSQKRGKEVGIQVGEYLLSNPFIGVIHVDEALQSYTWQIFQKVAEKNTSFVDCSSIAIIRAENLLDLLTFDVNDFKRLQKSYRFNLFS